MYYVEFVIIIVINVVANGIITTSGLTLQAYKARAAMLQDTVLRYAVIIVNG